MTNERLIKLPSEEELTEWMAKSFNHLNPEVKDFFYLGIEALYIKLGGNRFIKIR